MHFDDVPGTNPNRDEYLYWLTQEGYIIAQDVLSQREYIEMLSCSMCGGALKIAAHLNRAWQGLSEMICVCKECQHRYSIIFDISNEIYQQWWAEQLGSLYIRQYDGEPRQPFSPSPPD